jgi:hypothetical protein
MNGSTKVRERGKKGYRCYIRFRRSEKGGGKLRGGEPDGARLTEDEVVVEKDDEEFDSVRAKEMSTTMKRGRSGKDVPLLQQQLQPLPKEPFH